MIIGLMGVGGWGKNHAKTLARLKADGIIDDFVLIDIAEDVLKYATKLHGCRGYKSLDEALNKEELDGLIIATPTLFHYNHTKKALENNLHVLTEKPITARSEEALELIDLAKQRKRILMTGFLLRYSPAVQYLRNKLQENPKFLGKILVISTRRVNPWKIRKYDVGVVRDLIIHDIDLVSYIFGAEPKKVYGYTMTEGYEFEVFATGFVEYSSKIGKIILQFEASWIAPQKFRRWVISGTEKEIRLDLVNHTIEIYTKSEVIKPVLQARSDPLYLEDKNFVESIKGNEKPLVTGIDGYKALRTCESIIESSKQGKILNI